MSYRSFPHRQSQNRRKQRRLPQGRLVQSRRTHTNQARYVSSAQVTEPEVVITHQFQDFAIHEQLKKNIAARGYRVPTPIQDQAIPHILDRRDVVGIANTGTGKTAAFLVPLIHKIILDRSQKVLILVPTRELGAQIADELRAFSHFLPISHALCIGGANITRQIGELNRHPNIVIGTPGRLKDLIKRRVLHLAQFKTIVLDEVDRMVDIGFIKDIREIISLLGNDRQSLFFSATVTSQVTSIMNSFLKNPVTISVKKKETAQNVAQDVIHVKTKEEKLAKLSELLRQDEYKKVLIFGRTKWNVERLSKTLEKNGFSVVSIHGNKSQNQRLRALSQFKENQVQVMVATDVASRGLDIENVSHVINFDEPDSFENYVHRIGRTGRANKTGTALTFVM